MGNCSIVRKWASLNLIVQDSIFIFEREAEIRESRLGINGFFDRNSDLKSGYVDKLGIIFDFETFFFFLLGSWFRCQECFKKMGLNGVERIESEQAKYITLCSIEASRVANKRVFAQVLECWHIASERANTRKVIPTVVRESVSKFCLIEFPREISDGFEIIENIFGQDSTNNLLEKIE